MKNELQEAIEILQDLKRNRMWYQGKQREDIIATALRALRTMKWIEERPKAQITIEIKVILQHFKEEV